MKTRRRNSGKTEPRRSGTKKTVVFRPKTSRTGTDKLKARKAGHRKLSAADFARGKKAARIAGDAGHLIDLINSTGIAMLFLDTKLRLRGLTPAAGDLIDIASARIDRPLGQLVRKFSDQRLSSDVRSVLLTARPLEAEVVSESGRAYVRRALPYLTAAGAIDGIILTFTDITRLKLAETALRSSEERHRLILDGVAEYAILILDQDGRFVTWSPSAERILGYSQTEALGQPLELIYTEEDKSRQVMHHELQQALEKRSITEERWHLKKDRTRFWGTGVFSALYDEGNKLYGFVKVLRDNTDRKVVEEALQKAKTDAENANSAKDHFLANISHELRTPLSATLLWAKLLGAQPALPPQLREGLEAIEKSAKEQQTLIEDLVDTSRMVAGKLLLKMKEIEILSLVRSVLAVLRSTAGDKGIVIDEMLDERAGVVRADPMRMKQILNNLLTNAIKFTPAGGRVNLALRRQGEQIEIQVADTGQGIAPEFLGRVFDRFTQADPSGIRHTGGLGLGLAIARQLVEMHGGTIEAYSDGLAKGAVFTVRLPLPVILPSVVSVPVAAGKKPNLHGVNILLVEDVEETRKALAAVLADAGARVVSVDSAQNALEEFNRKRPDLILSDIGLGKVSGHELIQQIRQVEIAEKSGSCPALALTAYADERNRTIALESGFQQILIKPVEPLLLLSNLASLHTGGF